MRQKLWPELAPSLLVGAGIIVSTLVAGLVAGSARLALIAPLLLAVAVVSADLWDSRLRGDSSGPSPAALILGGAFVLAGWIVSLRDASLVQTLIPLAGMGAWVTLLLRPQSRHKACRLI